MPYGEMRPAHMIEAAMFRDIGRRMLVNGS